MGFAGHLKLHVGPAWIKLHVGPAWLNAGAQKLGRASLVENDP